MAAEQYKTEFEVKTNLEAVSKQLESAYISMQGMPEAAAELTKYLKRSTGSAEGLSKVISSIPAQLSKIEKMTKFEFVNKKTIAEMQGYASDLEHLQRQMSSGQMDPLQFGEAAKSVERITEFIGKLEKNYSGLIKKNEMNDAVLSKIEKTEKFIVQNSQNFKKSTSEISKEFSNQIGQLTKIKNSLEKEVEAGNVSVKSLKEKDAALSELMGKFSKSTQKQKAEAEEVDVTFRKINSTISDSVRFIKEAAKISATVDFGNVTSDLKKVNDEIQEMLDKGKYDEDVMKKKIEYTDELVKQYNEMKQIHSSINDALVDSQDLMKNLGNLSGIDSAQVASLYQNFKDAQAELSELVKTAKKNGEPLEEQNRLIEEQESKIKSLRDMYLSVKSVLQDTNKITGEMTAKTEEMKKRVRAKETEPVVGKEKKIDIGFDKGAIEQTELIQKGVGRVNKEVRDLIVEYQKGKKSLSEFKDEMEKLNDDMKLLVTAEETLNSEYKAGVEALRTVNRISTDLVESFEDLKSIGLQKEYAKQAGEVQKIKNEIIDMIALGETDTEKIKAKVGELKNAAEKLKINLKFQDELNAKEEMTNNKIKEKANLEVIAHKALIENLKKGGKGLSDNVMLWKEQFGLMKSKAVSKFGADGVMAMNMIKGAAVSMMAVLGPIAGLLSLSGFIKSMFEAEKQVKTARKQIVQMAADTHSAGKAFDQIKQGAFVSETVIEDMRKVTEKFIWSLGMSSEQVLQTMSSFAKEGFRATAILENQGSVFKEMMGMATALGMDIGDLASRAGQLRTEFAWNLSDVSQAFIMIKNDAEDAGVMTGKFFDKVMNASVGLGLYGQKVENISAVFGNLVKNMKLPENVALDAAANLTKGFSGLSTEMQIVTYKLGDGRKKWNEYASKQKETIKNRLSGIDSEIAAAKNAKNSELERQLLAEKAANIRERNTIDEYDALKGLAGMQARARKMDVGSQIMMQLDAVAKKFQIDINGGIEDVDTQMKNSMYEMEKLGETFGINRESMAAMQGYTTTLKQNALGLKKSLQDVVLTQQQKDKISEINADKLLTEQEKTRKIQKMILKTSKDNPGQEEMLKATEEIMTIARSAKSADKKALQMQIAMKQISGDNNENLAKLKDSFSLQFPELSQQIRNANSVGELTKVISTLDAGFNLTTATTDKLSAAAEIARKKEAGLQILKQTKSTEDALNNTIGRILRKGFLIVEKIANMFLFMNKRELKQFNEINDSAERNKSSADEQLAALKQKGDELDVQKGELSKTPDDVKKNKTLLDILDKQIEKIKQEKKMWEKVSDASSQLIADFSKNGKIDTNKTIEYASMLDTAIKTNKDRERSLQEEQTKAESPEMKQIIGEMKVQNKDKMSVPTVTQTTYEAGRSSLGTSGGVQTKTTIESPMDISFGDVKESKIDELIDEVKGSGKLSIDALQSLSPDIESFKQAISALSPEELNKVFETNAKVFNPKTGTKDDLKNALKNMKEMSKAIIKGRNRIKIAEEQSLQNVDKLDQKIKGDANIKAEFVQLTGGMSESDMVDALKGDQAKAYKDFSGEQKKVLSQSLKPGMDEKTVQAIFEKVKTMKEEDLKIAFETGVPVKPDVKGERGLIVPGNKKTGDKILAGVNSGEQILTVEQRKQLDSLKSGLNAQDITVNIPEINFPMNDLVSAIESLKVDQPTSTKAVNDSRVFNFQFNGIQPAEKQQIERVMKQIAEQVSLTTLYNSQL